MNSYNVEYAQKRSDFLYDYFQATISGKPGIFSNLLIHDRRNR